MTDKQLKLIYEYMGWKQGKTKTLPCPQCGYSTTKEHFPLNSNSAWEVVQEMERKGDWKEFLTETIFSSSNPILVNHTIYLMNPENFFNCFAKWLEERKEEGK